MSNRETKLQKQVEYLKDKLNNPVVDTSPTASEALKGFIAFLTKRKGMIAVGSAVDVKPIVDLLDKFEKANNLEGPRKEIFPENIEYPEEAE